MKVADDIRQGRCHYRGCANWRFWLCLECGAAICVRHAHLGDGGMLSDDRCPFCHGRELEKAPKHFHHFRSQRSHSYENKPIEREVSVDTVEQDIRRARRGLAKIKRGEHFI